MTCAASTNTDERGLACTEIVLFSLVLGLGGYLFIASLVGAATNRAERARLLAWAVDASEVHFSGRVCERLPLSGHTVLSHLRLRVANHVFSPGGLARIQGLPTFGQGGPAIGEYWEGKIRLQPEDRLRNPFQYGLFPAPSSLEGRAVGAGKRIPALSAMAAVNWKIRAKVREVLQQELKKIPRLSALATATWLGDESELRADFLFWNRAAGLGHVIAVSGQHLLILSTIIRFFLFVFFACSLVFRSWVRAERSLCGHRLKTFYQWSLPLAALFFALTCPEEGSVYRAFLAVLAVKGVSARAWSSSRIQIFCTALALALLLEPHRATDWGFLLSGAGSFLLVLWLVQDFECLNLRAYLGLAISMPILALPLQIHFFSRSDAWFLVHSVAFSWVWAVVWIPLGFTLPLVAFASEWLPFLSVALCVMEGVWQSFERIVPRAPMQEVVWVRPVFMEALFWMALAVGGTLSLAKRLTNLRQFGFKLRRTMR